MLRWQLTSFQRSPSPGRRERSENERSLRVAAQVHGDVREWQKCQALKVVTITQSLTPPHPRKLARRSQFLRPLVTTLLSCGQPDKRAYLKQACRRIGSAVFFLGQRPRSSGLRRGEDCPPSDIFSRGISRDFVVSTDVGNLKHVPQAAHHFSQYPKKYAR